MGRKKNRVVELVEELLRELGTELSPKATDRLQASFGNRKRKLGRVQNSCTVTGLCNQYLRFAKTYYRTRDGDCPKEAVAIGYALRPLKAIFGRSPAAEFGPRKLKEVREAMIAKKWSRGHVNMQTSRIKRMFKWAVSNELVPSSIHHALLSVDGLRAGRTTAYEPKPIKPVPESLVEATLPHVASPVAAMIKLQLLTGMRPGEVTIMRTCDIDRSVNPWIYTPEHHKTEQHGHERLIILGPKAQEIVTHFFVLQKPNAYLFSPIDADLERRQKLYDLCKTPLSCGNRPATNRKRWPKKKPGERYDTQAYGHAIRYGCVKAYPPPAGLEAEELKQWQREHRWHPHQLRHNAATRIRKQFGLDVAQVVLGHASLAVTQVYAEKDVSAAMQVMREVG